MGLQVRKRSKGKKSWWNGSYSRKGVGASGSVKLSDNVTWNTGDFINGKSRSRVTINFGNGYRYVWYPKKAKRTTQTADYDPVDVAPWTPEDTRRVWRILLYVFIVWMSLVFFDWFGFFFAIAFIIVYVVRN